jgi:hypothetical protein
MRNAWWWGALLFGCHRESSDPLDPPGGGSPPSTTPPSVSDTWGTADGFRVEDIGLDAGIQGWFDGHFQRGRACSPADFDGDGDLDLYVGNPSDLSYVLINDTAPGEHIHFTLSQIVLNGVQAWGADVADYDEDGDPDLFIPAGGNENPARDWLFRNEGGELVDVTEGAHLALLRQDGTPFTPQSVGGQWADFDRDGHLDLFVSQTYQGTVSSPADGSLVAKNQLWISDGNGRFSEQGDAAGLITRYGTRNSSFLDFDHDGDLDIYEHNTVGPDFLWKNRIVEDGVLTFEDVTKAMSLGGCDLGSPNSGTWASVASDVNSDGWADILVFRRGLPTPGEPEVHASGHLIFLNVQGTGFVEVGDQTHLNDNFLAFNHLENGVMGQQVYDVNADGYPDIFTGNGSPEAGEVNGFWITTGLSTLHVAGVGPVEIPQYTDVTYLVDFPVPEQVLLHAPGDGPAPGEYPAYPYRTHGMCAADFDGDGFPEIFEANGGPGKYPDDMASVMQEPARLWKMVLPDPRPHWLGVTLVGVGPTVPNDPIGAKVRLAVSHGDTSRVLHQVRWSGSGFAAGNQPELFFGLGLDDTVDRLSVIWPDGLNETFIATDVDQKLTLRYGSGIAVGPGDDTGL